MSGHFFISYSSKDAAVLAFQKWMSWRATTFSQPFQSRIVKLIKKQSKPSTEAV